MLHLTPLYGAVLGLIFILLSVRTLMRRRKALIALGSDKSDMDLLKRVRAHGNFAEYVPLALLLASFVEFSGANPWVVHAICASLLIGRIAHAYGVSQLKEDFRFRVLGMSLTFASISISAIAIGISAM